MEASSDEQETEDQAEVCRSRRWAIAAAAAVAVLIGGNGAWQLFDGDESVEKVHVAGPAHPSTGPVLEWTEFDPDVDDSDSLVMLEPFGDGRVLVRTFGYDTGGADSRYRFLVTENGLDWSEVPMPTEISPTSYDLSGDRWLVAGYDSTGETRPVAEGAEDGSGQILPSFRAFFSDDRGASWTEAEFDFSTTSTEMPSTYEQFPFFISVALTSKEHMVIVLQGDEEGGEIPKSWIMASEGGAFQQVAEYDGWILRGVIAGSVSTPAGFTFQLYAGGETENEQGPPQLSTLTSPDGRIWNESKTADPFAPTAPGPDGSLWRTSWLGTRYGLHRIDRKGTLKMEVAFDNSLPFQVAAGPSGLAVNAMTIPGTELFSLPDQRIAKDGYELRLNVPEGGFSLWHLETGAALYECGREVLWAWLEAFAEDVCEFRYPTTDNAEMDAVVLVFDDPQTGGELVSFTREELLPAFPLWAITGLAVDGFEEKQWLGWSADGVEWGWQSPADAFRIDPPSEANEALIQLAVGDGFVLALVERWSQHPLPSQGWFIARVP
ncbi:hypothetical protein [Candidatus Poriferisocius sp.]|uniref:hypothetical protein n=1 Tax=Candidatus Poriferisocius sp. TaxID=3101276 RepID=UPI003B51C545